MKNKQVTLGTVINYAALATQSLSIIITTPYIIAYLGDGSFGVYKIVTSLIAYMSILNFGFGNAAIRYLSEIREKNDKKREKEFLSVIKLLNLAAILVSCIVGILLYIAIPSAFSNSLTVNEVHLAQQLFIVLIASVVANISNDIYTAIISVHERFIFLKLVDLVRCVLRIILIISVLSVSSSAVVLVSIDLFLSVFVLLSNLLYSHFVLKVHPRYSLRVLQVLDKGYYKGVLAYAVLYFLNLIIDQLIWNTDSVIIGMRLSAVSAAVYGAGSTISMAFYTLTLVVGTILFPRVVRIVARGASEAELLQIFVRIGRIQAFISLCILTSYWVFGKQFVSLWLGSNYTEAWTTSLMVMVGSMFNSLISVGHLILRAKNRLKFFLYTYFFIFLANAVLTYWVVPYMGIFGAALMTMSSFAYGNIFILMPYYHKVIHLNMLTLAKKIAPVLLSALLLGAVSFIVAKALPIHTWGQLLLGIGIYVLVYGTMMLFLVFNKEEKQMVRGFFRRQ